MIKSMHNIEILWQMRDATVSNELWFLLCSD